MTIMTIECFDLLAAICEIESAVGKDSVHIEDNHTYLPGSFLYVLHQYYNGRLRGRPE